MAHWSNHWQHRRDELVDSREPSAIRRDYTSSLLSDAKWRKLIEAIGRPDIDAPLCIVKFVGAKHEQMMETPHSADIRTPSYLDTRFGPTRFRSIEWLEIPRVTVKVRYQGDPGVEVSQDADLARRAIESTGKYTIEETARGFRVIAHVARPLPEV